MTIFHYGLFSVHFSMLVNFKQKLVYLKYILFFPSLPTLKFPLRKSCLLKSILLSTQKDQTWSETNVMKLKLHFFFVKHCCLFQSKEARHAPLVWPGVEQLMILRHSRLKPCYEATTTYTDLKNPGAIGVGRWTQTAEELAMQSCLEIE